MKPKQNTKVIQSELLRADSQMSPVATHGNSSTALSILLPTLFLHFLSVHDLATMLSLSKTCKNYRNALLAQTDIMQHLRVLQGIYKQLQVGPAPNTDIVFVYQNIRLRIQMPHRYCWSLDTSYKRGSFEMHLNIDENQERVFFTQIDFIMIIHAFLPVLHRVRRYVTHPFGYQANCEYAMYSKGGLWNEQKHHSACIRYQNKVIRDRDDVVISEDCYKMWPIAKLKPIDNHGMFSK